MDRHKYDDDFMQSLKRAIRIWCMEDETGGNRDGIIEILKSSEVPVRNKLWTICADMLLSIAGEIINWKHSDRPAEQSEGREQLRAHLDEFLSKSNYSQAAQALGRAMPEVRNGLRPVDAFLLYYFVTHPNIQAYGNGSLTEEEKEELREQDKRFASFLEGVAGKRATMELEEASFIDDLENILKEEQQEEVQALQHLFSVPPKNHIIPNNKLANSLTKLPRPDADLALEVSRIGAKKLVETKVILDWSCENKACEERKVTMSGRRPFTEYDRNVYNAVSSLYVGGHQSHIMTPAIVHRAMTGASDTENPSKQQLAAVADSLEKMCCIRVQIDCTEELKDRRVTVNSKQINKGKITTYLLSADVIEVEAGGENVKAYQIIRPPILYEYAASCGQVLTVPTSLLDVKSLGKDGKPTRRSLANTEQRIVIKGYLLRRIEGMKGDNSLNSSVIALYDYEKSGEKHPGICGIAGKPNASRTEVHRIREDVERMLSYWRAVGYIKGYEAQAKGQKITGYKIEI